MQAPVPADIQRLETFLASAKRVSVVVHTHPDGDAVGSGAAMLAYLRQCRGRDACLLLPDAAPASLDFALPAECVIVAAREPEAVAARIAGSDLLVCLDMNGFSRAEALAAPLRDSAARKVLIDHHLNPERASFDLTFSETEISSACELLYRVLLALPGVGTADRLPLSVLTSLMTGMTTDTNNFANSVFPSTLQMASELLAAGVDRDALLDNLYHNYRENRFRAMGACLQERMRITPGIPPAFRPAGRGDRGLRQSPAGHRPGTDQPAAPRGRRPFPRVHPLERGNFRQPAGHGGLPRRRA